MKNDHRSRRKRDQRPSVSVCFRHLMLWKLTYLISQIAIRLLPNESFCDKLKAGIDAEKKQTVKMTAKCPLELRTYNSVRLIRCCVTQDVAIRCVHRNFYLCEECYSTLLDLSPDMIAKTNAYCCYAWQCVYDGIVGVNHVTDICRELGDELEM